MRLPPAVSRPLAVVAGCAVLTAGPVRPAAGAEAGPPRTAACTFVPAGRGAGGPPGPATATVFTSPDGFGGHRRIVGPANGTCVAHGGLDLDFDQQITLPGQRTPAFEQVFGAGGDYQLPYGCRYLPSIRRYAYPSTPPDCAPPPPAEHVEPVDTGTAALPAALVRVEPNTSDPQLRTTGTDPVLAVVLAFVPGGTGSDPAHPAVTTSYADCRLTVATTAVCVASLRAFVDEAIAFQRDTVGFQPAGDPGTRIRDALVAHAVSAARARHPR